MTEEIIINCAFYKDGVCASPINKTCEYCKNIDVSKCYHKQLKRLEKENKKLKKDVQLFKCLDTFGESECHCACRCLGNEFCEDADKKINTYRSALEEIREKAQHCIKQDVCALCDYSKECAVPDKDGLVYDNNRLLIKLINEVLE